MSHERMHSRIFVAGVVLVLFAMASEAFAQTWQSERKRLDAEFERIVDKARKDGATDLSGSEAEIAPLHAEYLQKVIKPALTQGRTCRQRMDAVELTISLERQAQLLGGSILNDKIVGDEMPLRPWDRPRAKR